jgi:spore maturation protein CgeB
MRIAFFGSSLLSSYWNGAATYYRGMIAALARRDCRTTFYEPDAFDRQRHRDMDPPPWAEVVVYDATLDGMRAACRSARSADLVVKASGVGVLDEEILAELLALASAQQVLVFWDVDAPATLAALSADRGHPLRAVLPRLDLVLTYGGGPPVVAEYEGFGARRCIPVYNALDPKTHYRVDPEPRFTCDLAFLGNRLPDREARVSQFFFDTARQIPHRSFLIGGAGWDAWQLPPNVRHVGHVPTRDHNAFNSSSLAVLNVARDSMAEVGFSPATRLFEAAGAGACVITDAWQGIELFLEPDREVLVAANGAEVVRQVSALTPARARQIGDRARHRLLREHTYDHRAEFVLPFLREAATEKRMRGAA